MPKRVSVHDKMASFFTYVAPSYASKLKFTRIKNKQFVIIMKKKTVKIKKPANSPCVCCIKYCGNRPSKNLGFHFYTFPTDSIFTTWRVKKRQLWLDAVQSHMKNQEDWPPKQGTVICSAHFIGNKHIDHPQHSSYIPAIFTIPTVSNHIFQSPSKPKHNLKKDLDTTKIFEGFKSKPVDVDLNSDVYHEQDLSNLMDELTNNITRNVACQTDTLESDNSSELKYFWCALRIENGYKTAQVQVGKCLLYFNDGTCFYHEKSLEDA